MSRLADFAPVVFARLVGDPNAVLLVSPVYIARLFMVLEEEIAKEVQAQAARIEDPTPAG